MIILLLITGYTDLFQRFDGFSTEQIYIQLMHGIGLLMVVLFAWLYFVPFRALSKAVATKDTPTAALVTGRMRPIMLTNLLLGLLNTAIGIGGHAL